LEVSLQDKIQPYLKIENLKMSTRSKRTMMRRMKRKKRKTKTMKRMMRVKSLKRRNCLLPRSQRLYKNHEAQFSSKLIIKY